MAKTIKFNLICDGKPVRTIEDLQNNFSIEDVLEYYDNKLLHRWLEVRGYSPELEKVTAITSNNKIEIAKKLISIFDISADAEKVEESIYMLKFLDERKKLCEIYEERKYKAADIIDDYETGYRQLVDSILEHPSDIAIIKASIAEMASNYSWALKLNYRELFWTLSRTSVLAVMCLLMNEKVRDYFLPTIVKKDTGTVTHDFGENNDKEAMYKKISAMIDSPEFEIALGKNLLSYQGATDSYWKDLESKGKQYMIISIKEGDFVRSCGNNGGDLSFADVSYNFVIVDGVDYKSNVKTHKIRYMEV